MLIGELHATEGFSEVGLWALRVILIGGALAMAPYTVTKLKMAIRAPDEGARTATDSDSDVAPAVPPTIAVL